MYNYVFWIPLNYSVTMFLDMSKYECTVCGYVYDPTEGDPSNGVPVNTPFEKLPPEWVCPICGATKDQFKKLNS